MAGTAVLKAKNMSPDKLGFEIYHVVLGAGDTDATITPTDIKWIDFVVVTPMSAASIATGIPYLDTFTPGDATVTIAGANSTSYLVKVVGKVS